jgi:hypothetical protein
MFTDNLFFHNKLTSALIFTSLGLIFFIFRQNDNPKLENIPQELNYSEKLTFFLIMMNFFFLILKLKFADF